MATNSTVSFLSKMSLDITCSICLEQVDDNNLKAIAKLKCGHMFHMACIGCEFNIKGIMQCPNCRVIEKSDWLFSVGAIENDENNEETDDEFSHFDPNAMHYCPFEFRMCPYHGVGEMHMLPREARRTQVASNGNNRVVPDVHFHQHSHVSPAPTFASSSNTSNSRNPSAVRIVNRLLNVGQPVLFRNGSSSSDNAGAIHMGSLVGATRVSTNRVNIGYGSPPQAFRQYQQPQGMLATLLPNTTNNVFGPELNLFDASNIATTPAPAPAPPHDPLALTLDMARPYHGMLTGPRAYATFGTHSITEEISHDAENPNAPAMFHFL